MYSIIGEEKVFVGYKVSEEKTKGDYSLQLDYYESHYGTTIVDEYDDEIALICINPGEVCRIYFELKIYYTKSMLKGGGSLLNVMMLLGAEYIKILINHYMRIYMEMMK